MPPCDKIPVSKTCKQQSTAGEAGKMRRRKGDGKELLDISSDSVDSKIDSSSQREWDLATQTLLLLTLCVEIWRHLPWHRSPSKAQRIAEFPVFNPKKISAVISPQETNILRHT